MMHGSRKLFPLAVAIAIAITLLPNDVSVAQAPAVTWSEPESIGEEMPSSWFPEIHADQYGTVRIIWESVRDTSEPSVGEENGGVLLLSELRDDQWTEPSDIYIKDVLNAARPILASDDKYLHLISRSPRPEGQITIQALSALYYMHAPLTADATNAQSWSTPVRISAAASYWAQIQPLGNGRVIIVYNQIIDPDSGEATDDTSPEIKTALFARISNDYGATWGQPKRISNTTNRVARSSLVVSPIDGTLILAWDEGYDNLTGQGIAAGIFTATSIDGGESWTVGGRVDPTRPDKRLVSFASRGSVESSTLVATGKTTMLVYRSTVEDVLLYRLSADQGRSWSDEMEIPNAKARPFLTPHNFDKLGLAGDSDGRIILVFVGQDANTETGLSVQSMTFEGRQWSAPAVLAAPDGYPEYPRIAVTNGNQIGLTYFVRDEAFVEGGHYVIWTVLGSTNAATVAPPPAPTAPEDSTVRPPESSGSESANVVELVPYPTVPADSESVPLTGELTSPRSVVSQPLITVALLTFGVLALSAIAFRSLKKLTGF